MRGLKKKRLVTYDYFDVRFSNARLFDVRYFHVDFHLIKSNFNYLNILSWGIQKKHLITYDFLTYVLLRHLF